MEESLLWNNPRWNAVLGILGDCSKGISLEDIYCERLLKDNKGDEHLVQREAKVPV
jgi:hypothetical protein